MPIPLENFYQESVRRFGVEVGRLRVSRWLSRADLVRGLDQVLYDNDTLRDKSLHVSEAWLSRLENGQMAKVPVWIIDPLCQVLNCKAEERTQLLDCIIPDVGAETPATSEEGHQASALRTAGCANKRKLTNRELDVLRLAAEGLISREVAERLCITKETVDTYWNRLREKTGIADRQQVIDWAAQQGLI